LTGARRFVLLHATGMVPDYFYPATVALCLAAVIAVYFYNNPLQHSRWFIMRRFINWCPLGMTCAFLCMGRYNIIVAQKPLMSKEDLGIIFGVGTWVYASSFLINGFALRRQRHPIHLPWISGGARRLAMAAGFCGSVRARRISVRAENLEQPSRRHKKI